jgi:hypothetical protein
MKVSAQVLDKQTGKPVPYASVSVTDSNGKSYGNGTMTDADGKFVMLTSDLDAPDRWVTISSVGYQANDFPPARFSGDTIKLDLEPKADEMENVVITAVKKTVKQVKQSNYALPIALASAAVITTAIYFYIRK